MARRTTRLAGLGEFGWLRKLLPSLYWPPSMRSRLCIGPGDDAGVLKVTPGKVLVASTDAMVEGVHFERAWYGWKDLGYKILAVNISDLAAMGGVKPVAALVTAAFPGDTPVDAVDKFYKGLEDGARRWNIGLLGGDTVGSKGGWMVSVTVLGEADRRHLIRRSTAKPGNLLVTSGPLGLAGAGLQVLQSGKQSWAWTRPLVNAFNRPEPRLNAGALLAKHRLATSLMDCSDGLEASVRILSEASGVGMEVDLLRLPLPPALRKWARLRGTEPWRYALQGGEDYELLFTIHPDDWARVKKTIPGAAVIGRILPSREGCRAVAPGQLLPLRGYGYSHFTK